MNNSDFNTEVESADKFGLLDDEVMTEFNELAEGLNLSDKQAEGVWNWIVEGTNEFVEEMIESADLYMENAENDLRNRFGRAFEARKKAALNLVQKFGGDEFIEFLKESGLCNCREFVEFLMNLADATGEDRGLVGEKYAEFSSKDKLKSQIEKMMAEPAYMQAQHPAHNSTVQAVYNLRKRLFDEN